MLLDERKRAPEDQEGYLVEPKFDGYRVLAEFGEGQCRMRSKNGMDCTKWFAEVAIALADLKCGRMIVDGEMCVLDEFGRSDFEAVHARARRRRYTEGAPVVTYCVFDLLVVNGRNITKEPLEERKARLANIFEAYQPEHTLYVQHMSSDDVVDPITWLYDHTLQLKLEGVVAKRADSIYRPGERVKEWFKLKRPGAVPPKRFKR
jgi:bifunctional non-homologous end joining protein LigD